MMAIIFGISVAVFLYTLLSVIFIFPPIQIFKSKKGNKKKLKGLFSKLHCKLRDEVASVIPVGELKRQSLTKALKTTGTSETPQQYIADTYLTGAGIFLLYLIPIILLPDYALGFILMAVLVCFLVLRNRYKQIFKAVDEHRIQVETEIPRFVSHTTEALKTNNNVLSIIDSYRENYSGPLVDELSETVGDMRTGNEEIALRRLDARMNSAILSELIRGLISVYSGEEMTEYFKNLGIKATEMWRQRIRANALRVEPKVSLASYIMFGVAMASMFIRLVQTLAVYVASMGGWL